MLRIVENNRSYTALESENGVVYYHYKSLRAWDKNLHGYEDNSTYSSGSFCKGEYQFIQDDDYRLFIYYTDGTTYSGEEKVKSIRINSILGACISTPNGEEFYGDCWKITYNEADECYYIREVTESYEDEVDAYKDGKLIENIKEEQI